MPLKLVLDTNLIVSAHLNPESLERLVLNLAISSTVNWYVTPTILAEYEEVLQRKKFKLDLKLIERALHLIATSSLLIIPKQQVFASADPDDNAFLECAVEAQADYLVTGNKKHFPAKWGKTRIVNARELIELMIAALAPGNSE